jgi:hypothetical protein
MVNVTLLPLYLTYTRCIKTWVGHTAVNPSLRESNTDFLSFSPTLVTILIELPWTYPIPNTVNEINMRNKAQKLEFSLQSRLNINRARKSGLATGNGESGSGL